MCFTRSCVLRRSLRSAHYGRYMWPQKKIQVDDLSKCRILLNFEKLLPVKRWNFRKTKWSHYNALTNKFAKTLLPPDSLDEMRLTRTSITPLRKHPKRLFHAGIEITIFRVGMQSVNPSTKPFCSLLRETTQVWLLQLCLPSLTEAKGSMVRGSSEHWLLTL